MDPPPALVARLFARLLGFLLRPRGLPALPEPAQLRRVLVVRPDDRVGNALLTIPLVRALQGLLPQAQIDLLLARSRAPLAAGLPGLRVIPFDKRSLFTSPLRFLRALWSLRGYDAAIDASHWHSFSLTSSLLARWASTGWVATTDRGPARSLATAAIAPPVKEEPDVVSKLELVRGLGLAPPALCPPLETALGRSPPQGRYAVINPGARKADHRWPARAFGQLAHELDRIHGIPCIVTWGPGERALAEEVREASNGTAKVANPTDLEGLASLFRGAALVATNDTGPLHLAVACGAPVLALQLSSDAARFGHPGPLFAAVAAARDDALQAALEAAARLLTLTPRGPSADLAPGPAFPAAGPEAT